MNRGLFYSNTSSSASTNISNNNNIIWFLAVCSLLATGGYLLGRFFGDSKPSRRKDNFLAEAALSWDESFQIQMAEIGVITRALKNFNNEADSIVKQMKRNQKIQLTSKQRYLQTATEQTALIESRDRNDCLKLWSELQELINNYPKSTFDENPCIKSIELYAQERIEHHEKILSIAGVLLPELSSLLNEAQLTYEAPTSANKR